jgi:hypothetical protein
VAVVKLTVVVLQCLCLLLSMPRAHDAIAYMQRVLPNRVEARPDMGSTGSTAQQQQQQDVLPCSCICNERAPICVTPGSTTSHLHKRLSAMPLRYLARADPMNICASCPRMQGLQMPSAQHRSNDSSSRTQRHQEVVGQK